MIQTVLGPIRPEQMTACMAHEHLTVYGPSEPSIGLLNDCAEKIVPQLTELRTRYGCNGFVELTCNASFGRNVVLCAEAARQSKCHVIASTGFFTVGRTPWWMKDATVKQLVKHWAKEARHGMDGTDIRPGVLKASTTVGKVREDRRRHYHPHALQKRLMEALARSHHETGLPITTHGFPRTIPHDLEFFESFGVPPSAVAFGHADSGGKIEHLLPAVDRGAFVLLNFCGGFQRWFRPCLNLIKGLIDRGYVKQILLSVDLSYRVDQSMILRPSPWPWLHASPRPRRTYRHMFTHVVPKLEKMGVTRKQILQMIRHNPRRHLGGPWS